MSRSLRFFRNAKNRRIDNINHIVRRLRHNQPEKNFSSAAATIPEDYGDDDNNVVPQNEHFPHLFSSLDLGPDIGKLPNRVIMGSMHTGLEGHSIPKLILPFLHADE
eukprot:436041_1